MEVDAFGQRAVEAGEGGFLGDGHGRAFGEGGDAVAFGDAAVFDDEGFAGEDAADAGEDGAGAGGVLDFEEFGADGGVDGAGDEIGRAHV